MAKDSTIKKGYKQTEIGVIPEDWDILCVEDSFEICNTLRFPISQSIRDRMVGIYPYYGPTGVQSYINEYRIDGEYALIGEDGDHFLKWRNHSMTLLVSGKFNVNNHAHLIKGLKNLTKWFYWYFANKDLTLHLTRQGAGRFKLTKNTLKQILCAIPPLEEQTAIAEVLSDTDALIENLENQIAKKKAIKQGTMQQLLTGKKRLPGFRGEWEVKKFKNLSTLEYGSSLESKEYDNFSESFVYGTSGIIGNSFKFLSVGESVVIGRKGTINKPIYIPKQQKFWVIDTAFYLKSEENIQYLFYLLSNIDFSKYNESTGVPSLNRNTFYEILVLIPNSIAEQTAIAEILSDMDSEIEVLEEKCEKYKKIKQGMMQQLLTGKIRLV